MINAYRILVGNMKRKQHSRDLGIDEWIILKLIIKKQSENVCVGFILFQWRALVNTVLNLRVP
jgi:hypothetical protein